MLLRVNRLNIEKIIILIVLVVNEIEIEFHHHGKNTVLLINILPFPQMWCFVRCK